MMGLFESQSHIVGIVNEFCDEYFTEDKIRQWVQSRGLPANVYQAFEASELGAYTRPVHMGGVECPFIERAALVAALMRRSGAMLPFLSDMISMALLSSMRTLTQEEIAEDFFNRTGRVSFSQAFTEPTAGSDATAVRTVVSMDDGGIFLDGQKSIVSNGQFASDTLVLASDPLFGGADGGLSLWLVPITVEGVATSPVNTIGQAMLAPAAIEFHHVKLSPDWRIQTEGKLDSMLKRQYELGRILVAASSFGLARAAADDAYEHAARHTVKGRTLGAIPQIQEKIANMEVRLHSMDALVCEAAIAADGTDSDVAHMSCALMKYAVPSMAVDVADDAVQIFGGRGYTDETRVGRIWQDCRGNQFAQGTDEIMPRVISKFLLADLR